MQGGQRAGELTVALFRPWRVDVACTQTCLYMPNRYLLIISCQRRSKGSCGIAMNQDDIWFEFDQYGFEPLQNTGYDVSQVLAWFHDIEVVVGLELEEF